MNRRYVGTLAKIDGTWRGHITDAVLDWPINFTAAWNGTEFVLEGELADPPDELWIECIDGERKKIVAKPASLFSASNDAPKWDIDGERPK